MSALTPLASGALATARERPSFATAEEAVRVLIETVKGGNLDALVAIFGDEGRDLVSSSDPATGRRNRDVFLAAVAERWRLEDRGPNRKELIVGNEDWPFSVPLTNDSGRWTFDTAAGKEEVLVRRIGRNELAAIDACRTYVEAQRAYAARGHDGKPAGLYARRFGSDPGTENGLYWPSARGARYSPLGPLVANAAQDGYQLGANPHGPTPFHGYYFRILESQGAGAAGGARDYVVDGRMSGGFALIAWPVEYDATGIMTFIVNQDGVVHEKDLGPDTHQVVTTITRYDPDQTWRVAPPRASQPR